MWELAGTLGILQTSRRPIRATTEAAGSSLRFFFEADGQPDDRGFGGSVARGGKIRVGRAALIDSAPRIHSRTG
jgi:hypothetical protein